MTPVKHRSHTDTRRTVEGQLRPLAKRLTPEQINERAVMIVARRTMAERYGMALHRIGILANSAFMVTHRRGIRGFFGRLWWLIAGAHVGTGR